jgi:hypothetical protein
MSDHCATCGWPRLHHRASPEGLRCPYQRQRRGAFALGPVKTFEPISNQPATGEHNG